MKISNYTDSLIDNILIMSLPVLVMAMTLTFSLVYFEVKIFSGNLSNLWVISGILFSVNFGAVYSFDTSTIEDEDKHKKTIINVNSLAISLVVVFVISSFLHIIATPADALTSEPINAIAAWHLASFIWYLANISLLYATKRQAEDVIWKNKKR